MQDKTELSANTQFNKVDSVSFLTTEYQQCFDHMRHYDSIQIELTKFAFTGFTAIVAGTSALFKYFDAQAYRDPVLGTMLFAGFFMGLLLLGLLVRNRLYFVVVARQVNAIRNYVLTNSELNFLEHNRAYLDPAEPASFNPWSAYTWMLVMIASLNGTLGLGASYLLINYSATTSATTNWVVSFVLGLVLVALQVFGAVGVLMKNETKKVS